MIEISISPTDYFSQVFPDIRTGRGRDVVRCCFHKDSRPSLSINLENGRFKCFACGVSGDLVDFHRLRHGLDFKEALRDLGGRSCFDACNAEARRKTRAIADWESLKRTWESSLPIAPKDPVARYLSRRGLTVYPDNCRHNPELGYYRGKDELVGKFPAMVAAMQNQSGVVVALHRTYLTEVGEKLALGPDDNPRKLTMPTVQEGITGSAIRLAIPSDKLAVAEGIETALSYSQLFGVPAWAAYSATNLKALWIPDHVSTVHICVDNDKAGHEAADVLETRLIREGKTVIKKPLPDAWTARRGADWNDVILEGKQ
jgi:hypothetical protein